MKDIVQIAKKLTIKKEQLILYGNHKAKINIGALDASKIKNQNSYWSHPLHLLKRAMAKPLLLSDLQMV